jgi:hypothetical protein
MRVSRLAADLTLCVLLLSQPAESVAQEPKREAKQESSISEDVTLYEILRRTNSRNYRQVLTDVLAAGRPKERSFNTLNPSYTCTLFIPQDPDLNFVGFYMHHYGNSTNDAVYANQIVGIIQPKTKVGIILCNPVNSNDYFEVRLLKDLANDKNYALTSDNRRVDIRPNGHVDKERKFSSFSYVESLLDSVLPALYKKTGLKR